MGRTKRNKPGSKRRAAEAEKKKAVEAAQEAAKEVVTPLVKQLTNTNAHERAWAATSIANLSFDVEALKTLKDAGVVHGLITCLEDQSIRVLQEVLGAIRNLLIATGQYLVKEFIPALDQIYQLTLKFRKMQDEPLDLATDKDDELPNIHELLEQSIACLWSLAEASDIATKKCSSDEMVGLLLELYFSTGSPLSLRKISGQTLNTITDDNVNVLQFFNPEILLKLGGLLSDSSFYSWENSMYEMSVLAGSILYNIRAVVPDSDLLVMYEQIVKLLTLTLTVDYENLLKNVLEAGQSIDKNIADAPNTEAAQAIGDSDLVTPENKHTAYLQQVNSNLSVMQLSLEVVANIFCQDLPEDEPMEQDFEILEEQEEVVSDLSKLLFLEPTPIFALISNICTMVPQNLEPAACKPFTLNLEKVQTRALVCLGNIFLSGSVDPWVQNHSQDFQHVWNSLFNTAIAVSQQVPIAIELMESIITCMWTISKTLLSSDIKYVPIESQIQFLFSAASTSLCAPESIRTKVVGILAYFARFEGNHELNRTIGDWIMHELQLCIQKTGIDGAEVLAELLNAVFDIYGDGSYDYDQPVFKSQNYLAKLKSIVGAVSKKVESLEGKKNRLKRDLCEEALLNLKAFIHYKEQE